ncbi:hypothetical protein K523DRAFT_358815 [Schizophyllum commune Tattone D]|nr:hypothetical protein K523DRAFT_358815 [Schizophyllum commune Tattone D]
MRAREVALGPVMRPRTPPLALVAGTPPPACLTRAEPPSRRFYAPLATRIAPPRLALGAPRLSAATNG